jgi:hypothetical protein
MDLRRVQSCMGGRLDSLLHSLTKSNIDTRWFAVILDLSDDYRLTLSHSQIMVSRSVSLARQVVREILSGIKAGRLARDNGMLPSKLS